VAQTMMKTRIFPMTAPRATGAMAGLMESKTAASVERQSTDGAGSMWKRLLAVDHSFGPLTPAVELAFAAAMLGVSGFIAWQIFD